MSVCLSVSHFLILLSHLIFFLSFFLSFSHRGDSSPIANLPIFFILTLSLNLVMSVVIFNSLRHTYYWQMHFSLDKTGPEPAAVAEQFRACVKFKLTLTRRPRFESLLGITISIAQMLKYSSSNQSGLTTQQGRIKCRQCVAKK